VSNLNRIGGVTICAFCGNSESLKNSHIIPKFVYDWLKETSATGYIRFSEVPNKREQDGIKTPLLCQCCEDRFSQWEKPASEKIFRPVIEDPTHHHEYRKWFAKFGASVCWRVGTFLNAQGGFKHFSDHLADAKNNALQRWKDFLIDKEPNPGRYELHILPLLGITNATAPEDLPSDINRYMLRTVDIDAVCTKTKAFIYAKMCHLLLLGFLEMPNAEAWRGTKVHINKGCIGGPVHYRIPDNFAKYLLGRARGLTDAHDSISERQWEKITEAYLRDPERSANSETLRARDLDVALRGRMVFRDTIK
jgi:hypothetical protein